MRISLLSTLLSFCLFSLANANVEPLVEQRFPPQILLVINEFMASNNDSVQDPQEQYDDWIEIYNYGVHTIDTGGMYLTDNLSDPVKWQIPVSEPALTTIEPGGPACTPISSSTPMAKKSACSKTTA